jgi:hypothetical protein
VAFQAYGGLLGYRLSSAALQTEDVDFAQFHSTSVAVEEGMPPLIDVLRQVEPTFREVPDRSDGRRTTRFQDRSGYRVEFLTPIRGPGEPGDRPVPMPALGGASAQPLQFLDFLIYQPVRAVILHGSGIPVLVPAPERFAVHKLIVASRRGGDGTAKSVKDRRQAQTLIWAMVATRQTEALADAYMEAVDRGPHWREAIMASIESYEDNVATTIRTVLSAAIRRLDADPADYVVGSVYDVEPWQL